ncbi:hypothetical protein [Streptomyces sp. NPDC097619]|uniref:hypothetical protein n=1 Tax=Streptomyces sp. NPDC097619 TaxID=3157228 RepID=UPI003334502B
MTDPLDTEVIDAEIVDAEPVDAELVPAGHRPLAGAQERHVVTMHTMLAPGQSPPRAGDERPPWTDADLRLTEEDVADLQAPDLAATTVTNLRSSLGAFERWCAAQRPPRVASPCTTATYTSYGLHLIRRGKAGEFKPSSVGKYMSRILNAQPEGIRPDPSVVRARLKVWQKEWRQSGGEVRRAPAVTIDYNLRVIAKIDESTAIGKRDAFLAALAYANLQRESELTDMLIGRIKIYDTGLMVTTATSKTDQAGKGATRFVTDREDLQLVRRARAWFAVLHELDAFAPHLPLFRALTVKGRLRKYPPERERGLRMRSGSLDDRLQVLAARAGVPVIDGRKVTSHGWRAGANTDMIEAKVPLLDRNLAGRWSPGSTTADTSYDRRHGLGTDDPLAHVPLFGGPAHQAVAEARRTQTP